MTKCIANWNWLPAHFLSRILIELKIIHDFMSSNHLNKNLICRYVFIFYFFFNLETRVHPWRIHVDVCMYVFVTKFKVKHLSTMLETRVRALGWEDSPGKEMAIHFSTIAWKIPWTEEPGRLKSMESQRVRHDWATSLSLYNL